ncbi:oligosaccharide flippase family protein [Rathayibacter agropyri]|uniref:oligosaccharide flippase family protein n=1 Tax=Rathayibacter agropyri TaxID=1634927 RepID=UPI0031B56E41
MTMSGSPRSGAARVGKETTLARSVLSSSVANLMAPLAAFATAPILAYSLGVEGRGEVAAATAPFLLATVVATIGVPEALTFFVARNVHAMKHAAGAALWLLILAGLSSGLVVWLAAPLLAGGRLEIEQMIQLSAAAIVPTLLLGGLRGIAAGRGRWNTITFERLLGSLLRFLPIAGLAAVGQLTPFTAFLVIALSPLAGAIAYVRLLRIDVGEEAEDDASNPTRRVRLREMFSYGGRVWVGSISGVLLSRLDQLLMIPQAGTYELGLYAVAVNVSEITLVLTSAVGTVIFATDARDRDNARVGSTSRITTCLAAIAALVIGFTMPLWLPILFGRDFTAAIASAAILLCAIVVGTPGSVAGSVLAARGNPGLRSASLVIAALVNTVVLFLLVPSLGAVGAALATLVGNAVAAAMNLFLARRRYAIPVTLMLGLRQSDVQAMIRPVSRRLARKPL